MDAAPSSNPPQFGTDIDAWIVALGTRPGAPPTASKARQLRHDVLLLARISQTLNGNGSIHNPARMLAAERQLAAEGYPATTRMRIVASWRSYSSWRTAPQATGALVATRRGGRPIGYDRADVTQMLVRALDPRYSRTHSAALDLALLALLLGAGLRVGEIAALRRSDVDISGEEVSAGNVPARRRKVPVATEVSMALGEYLTEAPDVSAGDEEGFVFSTSDGTPRRFPALRSRVERLCIGIRPSLTSLQRTRAFRHTYAFSMVAAGVEFDELTRRLGTAATDTARYYTTFDSSLAVDLSQLLRSARNGQLGADEAGDVVDR